MTLNRYLYFFVFLYVGLVIVGIFNNYSPVPFWDMWNGYLDFYIKVQNGDWYAWFAQHNEHRVFLSRILFWIDIHFFDGASYFLICCNFFLMTAISYVFYKYIDNLFKNDLDIKLPLILTTIIISFSWIQNNNITWGFQSQFFLAYLIPLISFYFLAKHVETKQYRFFLLAIISGILSVFTMGNGILALPLLIILGMFIGLTRYKLFILIVITILTLYLYFLNYLAPSGHGSLKETILHHTTEFILYVLTYLGGPFGKIFGSSKLIFTQMFGMLFVLSSLHFVVLAFKKKANVFIFSLLIFLCYIGGTALGTSGGRAIFGLEQALESRYMTPSLMGWITLLILCTYFYEKRVNAIKYLKILLIIIPLLFLYKQTKALKYKSDSDQMFAALALELSIHDEEFTKNIFPNYNWLCTLAEEPKKQNLSIFGNKNIKDIPLMLKENIQELPVNDFIGSLDEIQIINNEEQFYRVRGWIFDEKYKSIPDNGFIVNENGQIVGYILTGFDRPDVSNVIDKKARYSGYYGYLVKNYLGKDFYIVDKIKNKKLKIKLTIPPFEINNKVDFSNNNNNNIASNSNIINSSFEENKIFDFKPISGFKIFGSFIDGDKYKGYIKIELTKDNSQIVYMTGPNTNRQIIKVSEGDNVLYEGNLKVSRDWSSINFSFKNKNLIVEIIDTSSDWGEWSAIALRGVE